MMRKMKRLISAIAILVVLIGCQKEELKIIESDDEASIMEDIVLKGMILGVVAHDGSVDDVVDNSDCFSIDFPYVCFYNGHPYNVYSVEDLAIFTENDSLRPDFPVNITFANYETIKVPSLNVFTSLINQCADGILFNNIINCVDLIYPVSLSVYDPQTSNFETLVFNEDKETFLAVENFNENTIVTINYPIQITYLDNSVHTISSNEELKKQILILETICE